MIICSCAQLVCGGGACAVTDFLNRYRAANPDIPHPTLAQLRHAFYAEHPKPRCRGCWPSVEVELRQLLLNPHACLQPSSAH